MVTTASCFAQVSSLVDRRDFEWLGQIGLVAEQGQIRADVEPNALYCLLSTQRDSNANVIQPIGHPLILARTPQESFAPAR